jgi:L-fuconolactonase
MLRIDSHHHVWDLRVRDQEWLTGDYMRIRRSFAIADLIPELDAAGINSTVLVQTKTLPDETYEFLDIAQSDSRVAGVVGWLSMDDPDAMDQLDSYLAYPNGQWLVSVRDMVQSIDDPEYLARPQVIANLKSLGARGIAFDLLTRPHQLQAAIAATRQAPETRFVMDHLSKPRIAQGQFDDWADEMATLAQSANTTMKISGMVTEANWDDWSIATFQPYIDHVLDVFGPDRCMFGSDWPVCLAAASYSDVVAIVEHAVRNLPETDQESFWAHTAIDAYQLQDRL